MFKINVTKFGGNLNLERKAKFAEAVQIAEKWINSAEFSRWFLEKAEKKQFKQLTLEQQKLIPHDLLQLALKPATFEYYVQKKPWYKRFTSVMGWSTGNAIYTYTDIFDGMSIIGLAAHLAHESMHDLGFTHSVGYSHERDFSVPYMVGSWIESQRVK